MINIIRFRSKFLGKERVQSEHGTESLVPGSFENPSFHEEGGEEKANVSCIMYALVRD